MAHTLTWYPLYTVTVNGTAVTQPYTLQDGDVIVVTYPTVSIIASDAAPYVNEIAYSVGDEISLSDTDIYVGYGQSGGND